MTSRTAEVELVRPVTADAPGEVRSLESQADGQRRVAAPRTASAAALAVLLLVGLLVRLPGLSADPVVFHPTRQLHSAVVARAMYESLPVKDPAGARVTVVPSIEPPINEVFVAGVYAATGGERLWVARLVSSIYWLIGAAALWAMLRRVASLAGQVAGTALFLFAPLAVQGGRAFQPDSLMIGAALVGTWLLTLAREEPSRRRWAAAIVVCGFGILVKAVVAPLVVSYWVGLEVRDRGWVALARRRTWAVITAMVAATVAVYAWKLVANSSMQGHASASFFPSLFGEVSFYRGTWRRMTEAVAWPILAVALVIPFVARDRHRRLLLCLWLGYLAYNVPFNYRTLTHDYYHLPLVVVAAFGLAVATSVVERMLASSASVEVRRVLGAAFVAVVAVVAVAAARGASWEVIDASAHLARYRAIGQTVGPDEEALILDGDYGYSATYYGRVNVKAYPSELDARLDDLAGRQQATPEQTIAESEAEWFVVLDLDMLERMPALRSALGEYEQVVDEDGWSMWDLRSSAG